MQSSTVFLVTAEPAAFTELTRRLKQAGLHCETFATAEAFLAQFDPERHGCLLLDLPVPVMGGAELHRMLLQRQSTIPVILVTSLNEARSAMEILKGGALDFFEKSFDNEALLKALRHAIELDGANRHILRYRAELQRCFAQLTRREREIVDFMLESKTSREIAGWLNMSARTVESHRARIMRKMGADLLVELVRMAVTAYGCHCIHKQKYPSGALSSPVLSSSASDSQA
jgi:FixJ family two-component response regulator